MVRTLAQALDPLAGEGDAIKRLAILLPLRLAHRAGGDDEIALDDVALDEAARALAEDGDFVPAGALDPFAVVVRSKGERIGRNPNTGVEALILPRRVMVFKPSNFLNAKINGKRGAEEDQDYIRRRRACGVRPPMRRVRPSCVVTRDRAGRGQGTPGAV